MFPNERISPQCVRNVTWGQDVSCRNSHTVQLKGSLLYGGLACESRCYQLLRIAYGQKFLASVSKLAKSSCISHMHGFFSSMFVLFTS